MQTYPAAAITAVVDACPTRRAAIAMVRDEANAIIEQAERRARGFDKGQWRDDCRAVDRARHNRIDALVHQSVQVAFALSARFASDEPADPTDDDEAGFGAYDLCGTCDRPADVCECNRPVPTDTDVLLRDGTLLKLAKVPAGVDYWHAECSPPDDYHNPGATDDDCPNCGALADEVCRPIGKGTAAPESMRPTAAVRDASDPDPDPLLAAFDASLGNARNAPSDACGDLGMVDLDAECGPDGCGAGPGEPCKPSCRWAYGDNATDTDTDTSEG